ncbi:MAG: hypothetical protein GVY36_04635 [Verrucomicrobia bacterium]|jgi:predicted RNase H-like nuclease (RuvC/YqgF family)|nr:hypothetical protein [Verrucomicrobiota bacterium]
MNQVNKQFVRQCITFRELTRDVAPSTKNALAKLLNNSEIDYIIVLQTATKDRRKFLPAGKNMDFRSPRDAEGKVIGGMRMTAYVDLRAERAEVNKERQKARQTPSFSQRYSNPQPANDTNQKLNQAMRRIEALENKISSAKKQILSRDQMIAQLQSKVRNLQEKLATPEQDSSSSDEISKRYAAIESSEEELIERMNEYMEKEAELEQREENLFFLERKFHEAKQSEKETA